MHAWVSGQWHGSCHNVLVHFHPAALWAIPPQAGDAGTNSVLHRANLQVGMKPAWHSPVISRHCQQGLHKQTSQMVLRSVVKKGTQQRAGCLAQHARA